MADSAFEESAESDPVLAGLRQPHANESAEDLLAHYEQVLKVPPTTMLFAGAPSFEGSAVLFEDADPELEDGPVPAPVATMPAAWRRTSGDSGNEAG